MPDSGALVHTHGKAVRLQRLASKHKKGSAKPTVVDQCDLQGAKKYGGGVVCNMADVNPNSIPLNPNSTPNYPSSTLSSI